MVDGLTPEQLSELKEKCIFCQIASGNVASMKVWEDDRLVAILDINPANPGHILLLPKEHYAILPQMPEDEIAHTGMVAKHLSQALLKALQAKGTNVFIANGVAAGQRAMHFMLHIIPRMENDGLALSIPARKIDAKTQSEVLKLLKPVIAGKMGVVVEEEEETPVKAVSPKLAAASAEMEQDVEEEKAGKPAKKTVAKKQKKSDVALDEIADFFAGGKR